MTGGATPTGGAGLTGGTAQVGVLRRFSPAAGRTRGEWAWDIAIVSVSLLGVLLGYQPEFYPAIPSWWWPIDVALGLVATALLWWSRRFPVAVAVLMIVPGSLAISAGVPAVVVIARLALLARPRWSVLVTVITIACALPYHALAPVPGMDWLAWIIVIPLLYTLALCIGLLGRARRQVIVGLREAAARDRERYEERLSSTRRDERERIAREMHDVLAHRMSLLSMHAGALEYRATANGALAPHELTEAAGVIRENARAAVEDLRDLLGLLRSDDELGTGAPQPTLDDLPTLVAEAESSGQSVRFTSSLGPDVRPGTQRTVYRIVQEALTNARKHAPHSPVTVSVDRLGDRVEIRATNPLPPGITLHELPEHGNGLIGIEERVRIDGGEFEATVRGGRFELVATVPVGAA
ncbi:signal transduction histidine kinase [Microbacteriaceae bacterium SG_E_30_P1]|uniref:histidine kinase n=1 Tax=Antiquaquibacter oligotrophicus TaxID=2880260 RepID=A0ABT6KPC3_9MICO|nr:histidine kinase [Antiquaquibacter oligotrophicus]MDH6181852.1 signal transduction histidine kinase [Antiquaquibacter oligotrophicus]UDF12471.1 histidine kinase [Antiquaquibacter oligotrophicus]